MNYTEGIQDGMTLSEYALQCAHAILPDMRKGPLSAAIPDTVAPNAALAAFRTASEVEADRCKAMTLDEAEAEAEAQYQEDLAAVAAINAPHVAAENVYTAMMGQVNDWNPPTREHQNLKNFMIEQISSAIDIEVRKRPPPTRVTATEWRSVKRAAAEWGLEELETAADETERLTKRNQWVADLKAALA